MKNTKIYLKTLKALRLLSVIVFITMVTSCTNFLDIDPISTSTLATFYITEADFEQAVNGAYGELAKVYHSGGYYMLFGDLPSDNTTTLLIGGSRDSRKRPLDQFNADASNAHILRLWRSSYRTIQRANGVLSNIDEADIDQGNKDQYIGETKAIRARVYFNLIRLFGDVPLVTSSYADVIESYTQKRTPITEVYTQIEADLLDAISKLPLSYSDAESGKITKGAAQSMLGMVYLTQKRYPEAVTQFSTVIGSAEYSLLDNYGDNFAAGMQGNDEEIWKVQFSANAGNLGTTYPGWYAPRGSNGVLVTRSFGFNQPTQDIYDAYEAGDLRKDVSIGRGFTASNGSFIDAMWIRLYVDGLDEGANNSSNSDWIIYRYSNILLLCAEALNEVNTGPTDEAYNYINQVRQRAGLADLAGLDESSFREAVYQELRMEVAFEGKRWFDLVRTGRALSVMNTKFDAGAVLGPNARIEEYQLLFPIPQLEIVTAEAGIIEQNPGY